MWYFDGTFRVSPDIFTQVLTIFGTNNQNRENLDSGIIASVVQIIQTEMAHRSNFEARHLKFKVEAKNILKILENSL